MNMNKKPLDYQINCLQYEYKCTNSLFLTPLILLCALDSTNDQIGINLIQHSTLVISSIFVMISI